MFQKLKMKFSKLITKKTSGSSAITYRKKSSNLNSTMLNSSVLTNPLVKQQILLTDDLCRFQPQKNKQFLEDNTQVTPKLNLSIISNLGGSGSGKFLKNSAKRLQRNRLQHVTSKPFDYVLRSTLNLQQKTMIEQENNYNSLGQFNIKSTTESSNYNHQQKENTPQKQTPIKTLFQKIKSVSNLTYSATTPVTSITSPKMSRFSFSKLTKFVSRSALKVMNRKTSTDSLGESLHSDTSVTSSLSPETSILAYEEENNQLQKFQQQNMTPFIKTTYQSRATIGQTWGRQAQEQRRPVMGLTALMINKHKQAMQANQQNQQFTGVIMPNLYLVGLPIILNSTSLASVEKSSNAVPSNYDHLTRQTTPAKPTYKMSVFSKSTTCTTAVSGFYDSINF